jgi:pimeloyl-ACP methyl ester carboxylesterase
MTNQTNASAPRTSASAAPTQFAKTERNTLAYRKVGNGPAIILCTRFRGTLDLWDPLFLDELARNFTVITFDYSGIGRSSGEPPATVAAMAQDAKDLADALGLKKFIVGGWSMGGYAVAALVATAPESISHAILIGSNPTGANAHPSAQRFLEIAFKPQYDLGEETEVFFEPRSEASRKAARESHDRIAQRTTDLEPEVPPQVFTRLLQNIATDGDADPGHLREALQNTAVPILILSGDRDIALPTENWYPLSGKLPTAQHIVFPAAGHAPQHQYPTAAADYIATFVRTSR